MSRGLTSHEVSPTYAFVKMVEPLLNAYENFEIQGYVPGVDGYALTLRTNLLIHRRHTRKNTFKPHSVYQGTSLTALPGKGFMEAWLRNARIATLGFIEKGEYLDEIKFEDGFQSVKRKYNQWIYWDRRRNMTFGKVHTTPTKERKTK